LASCMAAMRLHRPALSAQIPFPGLASGSIVWVLTLKLAWMPLCACAEAGMRSRENNRSNESVVVVSLLMRMFPPGWTKKMRGG
jgi:hypothetical protein